MTKQRVVCVLLLALGFVSTLAVHAAEDTADAANRSTLKFNFGADLSGQDAYQDYQQADGRYAAERGYGFTFDTDSADVPQGKMLYRDRAKEGEPSTPEASVVIDVRNYGKPAEAHPPYTFRVDLADGRYRVTVTAGDPAATIRTLVHVGDAFDAEVDGALDEAASTSKVIHDSTKIIRREQPLDASTTFDVTRGYLLVGFRRNTNTTVNMASISQVIIEPLDNEAGSSVSE